MADNKQASRNPTQKAQSLALTPLNIKNFTDKVAKFQEQLGRLIPDSIKRAGMLTPERVTGQLANLYSTNEEVRKCSISSVLNSAAMACTVGLEFNTPLGHSAIIPYGGVATWQPMYRGLITLASRSGRVHDVKAKVVLQQDCFEWEEGSEKLVHRPAPRFENDFELLRDWRYVYSRIRWKDAPEMPSFYVLDRDEVERVRRISSKTKRDDSPWNTHTEEMIQKTAVKRQLKGVDLTSHLSMAVGLDDQAEADVAQSVILNWQDYRTAEDMDEPRKTQGQGVGEGERPKKQDEPHQDQDQDQDHSAQDTHAQSEGKQASEGPRPGGVSNDTPGPFDQEMFSAEEWEWMTDQGKKKGTFKTGGQLAGYIGRYEKTKGELLKEFEG